MNMAGTTKDYYYRKWIEANYRGSYLKTKAFAILYDKDPLSPGLIFPLHMLVWCSVAWAFIHSAITFLRPSLDFPTSCIFSAILSHTLGTPRSLVGLILF